MCPPAALWGYSPHLYFSISIQYPVYLFYNNLTKVSFNCDGRMLPQYPSQLKSVRTIFHQTDVYIKYKTIPPSKYKQFKFIISVHTIFNPSSEQPRHGAMAEIRDVQRWPGKVQQTLDQTCMLCFMMFKMTRGLK